MTERHNEAPIEIAGVALERLWELVPPVTRSSTYVPQANELRRVLDLLRKSKIEIIDVPSLVDLYQFDKRQAGYYIEAARELGVVEKFAVDAYRLSDLGLAIRNSPESIALTKFMSAVVGLPIVLRVLSELRQRPEHSVPRLELNTLVNDFSRARYKGSLSRRVDSLVSWLRWLENNSEFGLAE